jgi:hypothetical protein
MISAQVDQVQQDALIKKYMSLPNDVSWFVSFKIKIKSKLYYY